MTPIKPTLPVYLISPSSAVIDPTRLPLALATLRAQGFEPKLDRSAAARHQRFAGRDEVRLAAIDRAARQPAPIVMITRGGYGLTRLLGKIDFEALALAGKTWVGLSDFTAFQLGMLARAQAVTWAGPALMEDFGRVPPDEPDEVTLGTFGEAMRGELEIVGFQARGPKEVDVRGTLWGGNLSIVCAQLGTPYFPQVKGGVLFLEDVHEHPYRIERMLTQLLHAGVLDRQKAILLGYFNRYTLGENDRGFDLPAVLKWLRAQTRTPIITGLPFGHASPKLTLPHGAKVGVAMQGRTCYIVLPHSHAHSHARSHKH